MVRQIDVSLRIAFVVICFLSAATAAEQIPTKCQGPPRTRFPSFVCLERTTLTPLRTSSTKRLVANWSLLNCKRRIRKTITPLSSKSSARRRPAIAASQDGDRRTRSIRFRLCRLSNLGYEAAAAHKELPASVQFPGKDNHPIQSQRWMRPRAHLPDRAERCPQSTMLQGSPHGEDWKEMGSFLPSEIPGGKSSEGRGKLAKNSRDLEVKRSTTVQ